MVRDIYLTVYANLEFSLEDRYKVRNKNRITLKFVLFLQFTLNCTQRKFHSFKRRNITFEIVKTILEIVDK